MTQRSSGRFSTKGIHRLEAFKCAMERINADSQLLPNTTLVWNILDTAENPVVALASGLSLIDQNVTVVVGKARRG